MLLMLAGCTELGDDSIFTALPDAAASADAEPLLQPNLTSIQNNVFLPHCSCHRALPRAGLLSLKAGEEIAALVDVAANCSTVTMDRVVPGDPDNSFLIVKLAAHTEGGPLDCGDPMPLQPDPISQEKLDIVREWIENGANP